MNEKKLKKLLEENKMTADEILLLLADSFENYIIVRKDKDI